METKILISRGSAYKIEVDSGTMSQKNQIFLLQNIKTKNPILAVYKYRVFYI